MYWHFYYKFYLILCNIIDRINMIWTKAEVSLKSQIAYCMSWFEKHRFMKGMSTLAAGADGWRGLTKADPTGVAAEGLDKVRNTRWQIFSSAPFFSW